MVAPAEEAEHGSIDRTERSRRSKRGLMFRTTYKQTLATAFAGAALATAVGAANAPAMPADPVHDGYRSSSGEQIVLPSTPPSEPAPVEATAPSAGFDVSSAAIGALGTGMILVALTAGGLAWRRNPGPHSGAHA